VISDKTRAAFKQAVDRQEKLQSDIKQAREVLYTLAHKNLWRIQVRATRWEENRNYSHNKNYLDKYSDLPNALTNQAVIKTLLEGAIAEWVTELNNIALPEEVPDADN
jgi:hypothetical protein